LIFQKCGGKFGDESYGLKDNTIIALMSASSYGSSLGDKQILYRINTIHEIKDTDSCIQGIHDLPKEFNDLVDDMGALKAAGY
jgi:hypothetical protein